MAEFAHARVEHPSFEKGDGGAGIEAYCTVEVLNGFPELVVGPAGEASLGIETRVCWIGFDGLINLFDGLVVVARELEAGCGQDERIAFLGFGRWLSDFPVRCSRRNAAGRKDFT